MASTVEVSRGEKLTSVLDIRGPPGVRDNCLAGTIIRTESTGISQHLLSSLHATTSPTRLVVRQERSGQRSVESLSSFLNTMSGLFLSPCDTNLSPYYTNPSLATHIRHHITHSVTMGHISVTMGHISVTIHSQQTS